MKFIKSMLPLSLLFLFVTATSCKDPYPDLGDGLFAEITTNHGVMVLKLEFEKTPVTVANFVSLAEGNNKMVDSTYEGKNYYDGLTFHRIINDFMIQGGDPLGTGTGGPGYRFKDEITDLKHDKPGTLSMANSGPGTNGSQFFITEKETPWLDGRHTVFGYIVKGEDVLLKISDLETEPGDKPKEDVVMTTVKIIRQGKAAKKFKAADLFNNHFEEEEKLKAEKEARLKIAEEENAAILEEYKAQAETFDSGLMLYKITEGTGTKPENGTTVPVFYEGYFTNGKLFDSNVESVSRKFEMFNQRRLDGGGYDPMPVIVGPEAQMIPGFKEGVAALNIGDKAFLYLPSHLAYGPQGAGGVIPPNADLIFIIEMVDESPTATE